MTPTELDKFFEELYVLLQNHRVRLYSSYDPIYIHDDDDTGSLDAYDLEKMKSQFEY